MSRADRITQLGNDISSLKKKMHSTEEKLYDSRDKIKKYDGDLSSYKFELYIESRLRDEYSTAEDAELAAIGDPPKGIVVFFLFLVFVSERILLDVAIIGAVGYSNIALVLVWLAMAALCLYICLRYGSRFDEKRGRFVAWWLLGHIPVIGWLPTLYMCGHIPEEFEDERKKIREKYKYSWQKAESISRELTDDQKKKMYGDEYKIYCEKNSQNARDDEANYMNIIKKICAEIDEKKLELARLIAEQK